MKNKKRPAARIADRQENKLTLKEKSILKNAAAPVNKKEVQKIGVIKDKHRATIDEYFNNGFFSTKAVQAVYKNNALAAAPLWHKISTKAINAEYIKNKRAGLKRRATVENVQILRELIQHAYSDAATFIGLSPDEVKQLPPDVTRCIQSFEAKSHTYEDRNGLSHTEHTIKIKLIDKLKAIDIINKHIGFYEVDNKQKAARVNINNLPSATINVLLKAMQATNDE